MKAVVLSGGSGDRFWPASTPDMPKQFLDLLGKGTLLRNTVDRLLLRFDPKDVIVVTHKDQVTRTREILPDIPNIIGEPSRKNTAPACALGAMEAGEDEIQLVVPADHLIEDAEGFFKCVDAAVEEVECSGSLVTFGIPPTGPETGYGYIKAGQSTIRGTRKVIAFREKPDRDTALSFLSEGGYYWNSGIFVWRGSDLLTEMGKHEPVIRDAMSSSADLAEIYRYIPSISVDNAVMERTDRAMMVKAEFDWSDLGSWMAIADLVGSSGTDRERFVLKGKNVFIRSGGRPVAVVGLSDVIVVDSPEGVLVCGKDSAQDVRYAGLHFRKIG